MLHESWRCQHRCFFFIFTFYAGVCFPLVRFGRSYANYKVHENGCTNESKHPLYTNNRRSEYDDNNPESETNLHHPNSADFTLTGSLCGTGREYAMDMYTSGNQIKVDGKS